MSEIHLLVRNVRTVVATCACGASFEREVKRGRPQVWCPSCIETPFYERTRAQVATTTTEDGTVIEAKPVNENDPLGNFREALEADVAAFYAEWPALRAALPVDADAGHQQCLGLQAIYAKYRGK